MAKIRLNLEKLNERDLPSASLLNGVLTIEGTDARDVIVVRQKGDEIRVIGQKIDVNGDLETWVPASSVNRLDIATFGGNDVINLASLRMASNVDAGAGNDIVVGSQSNDSIFGGSGNDRLGGGGGDDSVDGQDGDDRLGGGSGDDSIMGGAGDDCGQGHGGDDSIFGGAGDDSLSGGADDDLVRGEEDDDRINGNSGDDDCDGGTGSDRCSGGGGHDSVRDDSDGRTEIEGVIAAIDLTTSVVSIQTRSGTLIDVTASPTTKIERDDAHVTLAAFQVGDFAEAKFNSTGATVELEAKSGAGGEDNPGDRRRVEGVITAIDLENKKVTIRRWSGSLVEVAVAPATKIERNDQHVTLAAFKIGDRGEARFDAGGLTIKLEAEGA